MIEVTGPELRLRASHGFTGAALEALRTTFPMPLEGQAPSAQAIRDRAMLHIADTETSSYRDFARTRGFRSILAIPVFREGQAIAAIAVGRAAAGPFSDRQIALLRIFADQAVIAIENVRLFQELEARNQATHRGARAADGHQRDPAGHLQLADRCPARFRHHRANAVDSVTELFGCSARSTARWFIAPAAYHTTSPSAGPWSACTRASSPTAVDRTNDPRPGGRPCSGRSESTRSSRSGSSRWPGG